MQSIETGYRPKEKRPSKEQLHEQLKEQYDFLAEVGMKTSFEHIVESACKNKGWRQVRAVRNGNIDARECKKHLIKNQPDVLNLPPEQTRQLSMGMDAVVDTIQTIRQSFGQFQLPDELKRPPRKRVKPTHIQAPLL